MGTWVILRKQARSPIMTESSIDAVQDENALNGFLSGPDRVYIAADGSNVPFQFGTAEQALKFALERYGGTFARIAFMPIVVGDVVSGFDIGD